MNYPIDFLENYLSEREFNVKKLITTKKAICIIHLIVFYHILYLL